MCPTPLFPTVQESQVDSLMASLGTLPTLLQHVFVLQVRLKVLSRSRFRVDHASSLRSPLVSHAGLDGRTPGTASLGGFSRVLCERSHGVHGRIDGCGDSRRRRVSSGNGGAPSQAEVLGDGPLVGYAGVSPDGGGPGDLCRVSDSGALGAEAPAPSGVPDAGGLRRQCSKGFSAVSPDGDPVQAGLCEVTSDLSGFLTCFWIIREFRIHCVGHHIHVHARHGLAHLLYALHSHLLWLLLLLDCPLLLVPLVLCPMLKLLPMHVLMPVPCMFGPRVFARFPEGGRAPKVGFPSGPKIRALILEGQSLIFGRPVVYGGRL